MLSVDKLLPRGRGLAPALLRRSACVVLDWDTRQKSRFDATDSQGRALGVFLPRGTVVRGGDVLVAEDGSLIRVEAAPQAVMVVRHCAEHGSPFDLLRAAYHLGNRHVALELQSDRLQLEPDHVLAAMLRQMHLIVADANAPFEPEGGAYAAGSRAQASHEPHSHESHSHEAHPHEPHSHESHSHEAHSHESHSHEAHSHESHSHGQESHAAHSREPHSHGSHSPEPHSHGQHAHGDEPKG